MSDIVFIADFFVEQILGGGEINNEELIQILLSQGYTVHKLQSHLVTRSVIEASRDSVFIVANFINLSEEVKSTLQSRKYIIYEHDHKYLKSRNPATYPNFVAPPEELVNEKFYQNATAVLCQSIFHKDIVHKNLGIDNIVSLGGNLWSKQQLSLLSEMSKVEKADKYSIMESSIPHKNTLDAIRYCSIKRIPYELIPSLPYEEFLRRLGSNQSLIFLPKTPETLSRIVVEARMMDMKVVTNGLVGASKETWFSLRGDDLIAVMQEKREEIPLIIKKELGI
jgi:hypothetical protein